MALTEATYTYESVGCPEVVLTVTTNAETGQVFYSAVVNLLELSPVRTTTAEERTAGIASLDPPTVTSQLAQELIDLAIRACASSYDATDGYEIDPDAYARIAYSVPKTVAGALRLAGVDT